MGILGFDGMRAHIVLKLLPEALFAALSCVRIYGQETNDISRMEPVEVFARSGGIHDVSSESDLVGPAHQPEWTTRRAFAETDIYVIPPGEMEFNQFYVLSHPRHGKPENIFESEFEFGLP